VSPNPVVFIGKCSDISAVVPEAKVAVLSSSKVVIYLGELLPVDITFVA